MIRRVPTSSRLRVAVLSSLLVAAAYGQEKTPPPAAEEKKPSDLGGRLIRKAVTESDEDVMAKVLRLMAETAHKLEIEFDAGEETQAMQQRIMGRLDEAIKTAAAQRRMRKPTTPSTSPDKRRMPSAGKRGKEEGSPSQGPAAESSSSEKPSPGAAATVDPLQGELRDPRRGWGHLPQREREEVIQGVGEGCLERYRAWIERYYRALQETNE